MAQDRRKSDARYEAKRRRTRVSVLARLTLDEHARLLVEVHPGESMGAALVRLAGLAHAAASADVDCR